MSFYCWEYGTITLPAASVAHMKKTLRDAANRHHTRVRTEAARLHHLAGTRSVPRYCEVLGFDCYPEWSAVRTPSPDEAIATAQQLLIHLAQRAITGKGTLHTPTVADVNRFAPRYNNRATHFVVMSPYGTHAATITFDGRAVTWNVDDNNHAVEEAHATYLARAFFNELEGIRWTRGTGGILFGNDEYTSEEMSPGGGRQLCHRSVRPQGGSPVAATPLSTPTGGPRFRRPPVGVGVLCCHVVDRCRLRCRRVDVHSLFGGHFVEGERRRHLLQ